MSALLTMQPDAIDTMAGITHFYFGANPATLARTPHGTYFSVVYLSEASAYIVKFRVVPGNPDRANDSGFVPPEYAQVDKRALSADEVAHFERLAA